MAVGVTRRGRIEPLDCFTKMHWAEIEKIVKKRIKKAKHLGIPFLYDGEPGLDNFLADVVKPQRCTWYGPKGLLRALWEDGLKNKESWPHTDKIKRLIGIDLPEGDYEILKEQDKDKVREKYENSKKEIAELVKTFSDKSYQHGTSYLENLSSRLFTNIEIWLKTGVIAPKTSSMLDGYLGRSAEDSRELPGNGRTRP